MHNILPTRLALFFCLATAPLIVASDPMESKGRALAEALDVRDAGYGDLAGQVTMEIDNGKGSAFVRKLEVRSLERESDGDLSLMRFDFPPDVRGTALLTHPRFGADDSQWLYIPSINRVKRISARDKSGSFVGSEFSFEDLSDKFVEDYDYRHLGEKMCELSLHHGEGSQHETITCEVLERTPRDKHSGYSKEVLYIDPTHHRIISAEYFDRKADLLKTFSAFEFKQFEGRYWRPLKVTMENVQNGRVTTLVYESIDFGQSLQEQEFSRNSLGR